MNGIEKLNNLVNKAEASTLPTVNFYGGSQRSTASNIPNITTLNQGKKYCQSLGLVLSNSRDWGLTITPHHKKWKKNGQAITKKKIEAVSDHPGELDEVGGNAFHMHQGLKNQGYEYDPEGDSHGRGRIPGPGGPFHNGEADDDRSYSSLEEADFTGILGTGLIAYFTAKVALSWASQIATRIQVSMKKKQTMSKWNRTSGLGGGHVIFYKVGFDTDGYPKSLTLATSPKNPKFTRTFKLESGNLTKLSKQKIVEQVNRYRYFLRKKKEADIKSSVFEHFVDGKKRKKHTASEEPRRTMTIATVDYIEIAKSDNQSFSALMSRRGWKSHKFDRMKPGEFYRAFSLNGKHPDVVLRWQDGKPGVELIFYPAMVKVGARGASLKDSFVRACDKASKVRIDAKHIKKFSEVLKKIELSKTKSAGKKDKGLTPILDESETKGKGKGKGASSSGGGGGGGWSMSVPTVSDKVEKIGDYLERFRIKGDDEPKTAVEKYNNMRKVMEKVVGNDGRKGLKLASVQYLHHKMFGDGSKKLNRNVAKATSKKKLVESFMAEMYGSVRSQQAREITGDRGVVKRKARNRRYDKKRGFKGLFHPDKEKPGFKIFKKAEDEVSARLSVIAKAAAKPASKKMAVKVKKKAPAKKPATKKVVKKPPAKKAAGKKPAPKSPAKKATRKSPAATVTRSKKNTAKKPVAKPVSKPEDKPVAAPATGKSHVERAKEFSKSRNLKAREFNTALANWIFEKKLNQPNTTKDAILGVYVTTFSNISRRIGAAKFDALFDEFLEWAKSQTDYTYASFKDLAARKPAKKAAKKKVAKKSAKKAPAKKKAAAKKAPAKKTTKSAGKKSKPSVKKSKTTKPAKPEVKRYRNAVDKYYKEMETALKEFGFEPGRIRDDFINAENSKYKGSIALIVRDMSAGPMFGVDYFPADNKTERFSVSPEKSLNTPQAAMQKFVSVLEAMTAGGPMSKALAVMRLYADKHNISVYDLNREFVLFMKDNGHTFGESATKDYSSIALTATEIVEAIGIRKYAENVVKFINSRTNKGDIKQAKRDLENFRKTIRPNGNNWSKQKLAVEFARFCADHHRVQYPPANILRNLDRTLAYLGGFMGFGKLAKIVKDYVGSFEPVKAFAEFK